MGVKISILYIIEHTHWAGWWRLQSSRCSFWHIWGDKFCSYSSAAWVALTSGDVSGQGGLSGLPTHSSIDSWVSKNSSGPSGDWGVWELEPASLLLSLSSNSTGSEPGRQYPSIRPSVSSINAEQGARRLGSTSVSAGASSEHSGLPECSLVIAWYSVSSSGKLFGVSGTSTDGQVGSTCGPRVGAGWEEIFWEEWVSSLLWGVREIFSLKLKRGDVSAVVGEDGPALDTVLDGPLLSTGSENKHPGQAWEEITGL